MEYKFTPRRFLCYLICLAVFLLSLCVVIYYFPFNLSFLNKVDETGVRIPVQDRRGKWGYIDDKGKVAIPFTFDSELLGFDGPYAVADNKFFIDRTGERVSEVYTLVNPFRESGLAMVTISGTQKGFVDRSLNVVINFDWDVQLSFDDYDFPDY